MMWVTNYASLFLDPQHSIRLCWMPIGARVEPTGAEQTFNGVRYLEVKYFTSAAPQTGWVYSNYVEELVNEFPECVVPTANPTPNPNDAGQDIIYLGNVQFNLCGEFCVAFIVGDSIEQLLQKWQPKSPDLFRRIFPGGRSLPTGADEVSNMLSVYGLTGQSISGLVNDPIKGGVLVTPGRVAALTPDYHLILGVKIDKFSGLLRGSGIGHWVCVERVVPDGIGRGWVEFYNPFPNQIQRESWNTVVSSMGSQPYGLAVRRQA